LWETTYGEHFLSYYGLLKTELTLCKSTFHDFVEILDPNVMPFQSRQLTSEHVILMLYIGIDIPQNILEIADLLGQ
jgi:hypothetical protein